MIDYSKYSLEDIDNMSDLEYLVACGLPDGCDPVWDYEVPPTLNALQASEYKNRYIVVIPDPDEKGTVGGSGLVTPAFDMELQPLAVKRLRPLPRLPGQTNEEYARAAELRLTAFHEEFLLLSRLGSFSQFPSAYGYGKIDGDPVILMEWIDGVSFERLIQRGAPPNGRCSYSAFEVALLGRSLFNVLKILEELGEGFVHRDLSPANVIWRMTEGDCESQVISGEIDICLIDFGSSVLDLPFADVRDSTASSWRGTTLEYAPPEMLIDDLPNVIALRNSSKVDVYAACSILYEMLMGDTPFRLYAFEGNSRDYALRKIDNAPSQKPGLVNTATEALVSILERGLAAQQDARPSAQAMARALSRFLSECGDCDTAENRWVLPAPIDPNAFFAPEVDSAMSVGSQEHVACMDEWPVQIVRIDAFEPAPDLSEGQRRGYSRRFSVLRLDGAKRVCGPFRMQRAYTAENCAVAIVSYNPPAVENGDSQSAGVVYTLIEKRLRAERVALMKLSMFRQFPVAHGMGELEGKPVLIEEWVDGVPVSNVVERLVSEDDGSSDASLSIAPASEALFAQIEQTLNRLAKYGVGSVLKGVSIGSVIFSSPLDNLARCIQSGEIEFRFSLATQRENETAERFIAIPRKD